MRHAIVPSALLLAGVSGCGLLPSGVPHGVKVPDGFEVELAAGPPLVERPMIVDMDDQGRLYVAESSGSNDDVQRQLAERPHSILRLEDLDGDGRYDRRTVFADRMMLPEGVLWHDGSVYVAAPPSIWKLTDTDGDGVADRREEWFDAQTLTNCANDLHGPYLGLDGWIYWTKGAFAEQSYERPGREPLVTRAAHVFRRRPEGGPVEAVLTGGMDNPVEVAFTPEGERLLTSTFLAHPRLGRRDGIVHAVYGGVYGKVHGVTDGHPMTGGYLAVMTHMGSAAPVGLARYASGVFGESYRGRLFATAFNLRKVTAHRLVPSGATFRTEDEDFLISESRDFHPTDVMEDADGSLLVVDTGAWYKLCCPTSQLAKPDVLGAIYRVRKKGAAVPEDPLGLGIEWPSAMPERLVGLLADDRPAVRRRAVAALSAAEATGDLARTLTRGRSPDERRNAVWALTRIDSDGARAAVRVGLADESPSVRQAALHAVALHRDPAAARAVAELLADPSDAVKRAAAEAAGRIGDPAAVGPLLDAAGRAEGEVLTHSIVYALIEIADAEATRDGLSADSARTRRAALIALDQMRPRALDADAVLPLLRSLEPLLSQAALWIAGRHPEWGSLLAGDLARRLAARPLGDADSLARDLQAFAGSPEVQALLARTARRGPSPEARAAALEAMAGAALDSIPAGWESAVAAALTHPETVDGALLAARRLARPDGGALPVLDAALLRVARDESLDGPVRTRALAACAASLDTLEPALFDLAAAHVAPPADVRARGAAATALSVAALGPEQLLGLADLLPRAGPLELPRLVGAFQGAEGRAIGSRFADALSSAKGIANLRADIAASASAGFPADIRARVDKLLEGEVGDLAAQSASLERMLDALPAGDILRGQAVFNSSEAACMACHAIGHLGGRIGPDLTRIGQIRDRRDLLEAIVYPSASFVRSYEPVVAVTADASYSGVPLEDGEAHLLLALDANDQVRIARSAIEEVRPGTVSIMPAGLADQLSPGQLADLLAFLAATQWGPARGGR